MSSGFRELTIALYHPPNIIRHRFMDLRGFPCYISDMALRGISRAKRHAIYVGRLKRQTTAAERRFCWGLAQLGLDYRFQQGFYHPHYRIADFYLPGHNLIIEIDGPYHDPENDQLRDESFERARGLRTLRLTNEQVVSGDFELHLSAGNCPNFVPVKLISC
jgi:very-short-patch-repair endonuclease